jgi:hypothetical protein
LKNIHEYLIQHSWKSGGTIYHFKWVKVPDTSQGQIHHFKLGGVGAYFKKLCRAEGGAEIFGVFRVKNHDFTPKNLIFSNFRGGRGACRVHGNSTLPPGSTLAFPYWKAWLTAGVFQIVLWHFKTLSVYLVLFHIQYAECNILVFQLHSQWVHCVKSPARLLTKTTPW